MTDQIALICDDRPDRAKTWKRIVEKRLPTTGWHVDALTGAGLAHLIDGLNGLELISRGSSDSLSDDQSQAIALLDKAAIVILDSDLSPSPADLEKLRDEAESVGRSLRNRSGDDVARQVRTHTTAGFIVVVNMFVGKDSANQTFDLTLTQGLSTFADLHVGEGDLDDESLWTGRAAKVSGYNPWARPALTGAPDWIARSEAAIGDLQAAILPTLGLRADALTIEQLDLFRRDDPNKSTFAQLAASRMGFRYPDAIHDEAAVRRMSASVVRRWLSRSVVPSADAISDAPHLISRFPQLLGESVDDVDAWNGTTNKTGGAGLASAKAAQLDTLTSFYDRDLFSVADARLIANATPRPSATTLQVVFLEDASTFASPDEADEVQTDVSGAYFRRFVTKARSSKIAYEPFTRLLT